MIRQARTGPNLAARARSSSARSLAVRRPASRFWAARPAAAVTR